MYIEVSQFLLLERKKKCRELKAEFELCVQEKDQFCLIEKGHPMHHAW